MKNQNQTLENRIAKWDTATIRETIKNYKRTTKQYKPSERDAHYTRLLVTIDALQNELATRN